jgi:hypothetical protein
MGLTTEASLWSSWRASSALGYDTRCVYVVMRGLRDWEGTDGVDLGLGVKRLIDGEDDVVLR